MLNLKPLRLSAQLTQAALANALGTTQQTVGRWETGKSEPSIADLGKLASVLGVPVAQLLGNESLSRKTPIAKYWASLPEADWERGWWGNIGIRASANQPSTWYPISVAAANDFRSRIRSLTAASQAVVVETMNNRCLILRPSGIALIRLLQEEADEPTDDWTFGKHDDYEPVPQKIYEGLAVEFEGYDASEDDSEGTIVSHEVRRFIVDRKINTEVYFSHYRSTRLHTASGLTHRFLIDEEGLEDLWFAMEAAGEWPFVTFLTDIGGGEFVIASNEIALIDTPLDKVIALQESASEQLEEDAAIAEMKGSALKNRRVKRAQKK